MASYIHIHMYILLPYIQHIYSMYINYQPYYYQSTFSSVQVYMQCLLSFKFLFNFLSCNGVLKQSL
ncbi:hypothetical protein DFH27DRAFT_543007 [Peziza echinospora]|nr:hypothetical protein DFH27DRAFT_543007 [Peziza echinospora]